MQDTQQRTAYTRIDLDTHPSKATGQEKEKIASLQAAIRRLRSIAESDAATKNVGDLMAAVLNRIDRFPESDVSRPTGSTTAEELRAKYVALFTDDRTEQAAIRAYRAAGAADRELARQLNNRIDYEKEMREEFNEASVRGGRAFSDILGRKGGAYRIAEKAAGYASQFGQAVAAGEDLRAFADTMAPFLIQQMAVSLRDVTAGGVHYYSDDESLAAARAAADVLGDIRYAYGQLDDNPAVVKLDDLRAI